MRSTARLSNRTHAELVNILAGYERRVLNLRAKSHPATVR